MLCEGGTCWRRCAPTLRAPSSCLSVVTMNRPRRHILFIATLAALTIPIALLPPAAAEPPTIAARQRTEKKNFTDSEIVEGFMKTAFGAEYHLAGRVDRIRKYEVPVRVFADGRADRKAQIAKIVADIAAHVKHLDIAMVEKNDDAN